MSFKCTYDFDVTIYSTGDIDEQKLRSQLSISPNPATDKIIITNTSNKKVINISVYDLSGKKLFEAESASEINISTYVPGTYFAKITMDNGSIVPMRFVKN